MISFNTKDFIKYLKNTRQIEDTTTISNFISIISCTSNLEKESLLKNDINYLEQLYKEFKVELSNFNNWIANITPTNTTASMRSLLQRKMGYQELGDDFCISNEDIIKKINLTHINGNKDELLFEHLYSGEIYPNYLEKFLKSKNNASQTKEVIDKILDIKPFDYFDDEDDYI